MGRYEHCGRRMLMEFTCGRCGKTHIAPYATQAKSAEGNIQCFSPPEGWLRDGLYNPMLCDKCAEAYRKFLKNEDGEKHE